MCLRARSHPETLLATAQFSVQKRAIFCKVKEGKGLHGGVLVYTAQGNPKPDAEIAEMGRFSVSC